MSRLQPHLEAVTLPLRECVFESGTRLPFINFPTAGIFSLLNVMENGASGEIAVVGSEGVVGIALFMGGDTSPSRAAAGCRS